VTTKLCIIGIIGIVGLELYMDPTYRALFGFVGMLILGGMAFFDLWQQYDHIPNTEGHLNIPTPRALATVHTGQIEDGAITRVKLAADALTNELITKLFTYETTSPVLLKTTTADDLISTVLVTIEETFNGMISLTIGDTADHARFMASTDIDPGTPGLYQVSPNYRYAAVTPIYLYLACVGATTGSGRVSLD
jgi:hypothetical protein